MTSDQVAQSIRKVLDTTEAEAERFGVVVVAHQIAADCINTDDRLSEGAFLRRCGL